MLLFCAFASGILFAGASAALAGIPFYILMLFILFIGLELGGKLRNWTFTLLLIISSFMLGAALYQVNTSDADKLLDEGVSMKNAVYGVKLNEVTETESEWLKCVGTIDKVYLQSEIKEFEISALFFIKKMDLPVVKGDHLIISSKVETIQNKGNPGEFDAEKYWKGKGVKHVAFVGENEYQLLDHEDVSKFEYYTDKLREYCSRALRENFGGQEGAVLSAIVLGDKSMLSDETRNSFMNTGAMHVLAVSGLHIGLILYLLLFVTERFSKFISRKSALIAILVFLWIYALVTGMSPSVIRAVFMFSMLSISQLVSRDYDPINILFFTAFCLLIYDPLYIYDIGFQLSYLAMLGIFLFYEKIDKLVVVKNSILNKIWQGTAIGLAAQIMTTPLSLYYFHQFPNYFILSNLGLMATSGLILGLGIAVLAVYKIPFLLKPIILFLWATLFVTLGFLSWVEHLPGSVAFGYDLNVWQGLMLLVGCFVLFFAHSMRSKIWIATPLILMSVCWISLDRFDRMSGNEIYVFAHSKPLITLKQGDEIHCFYQAKTEKDQKKAEMIVGAYAKENPGEVIYHEITDKSISVQYEQLTLTINPIKNALSLEVNSKVYSIVMKNEMQVEDLLASFRIGMPWVEGGLDHSLKDGALQIEL